MTVGQELDQAREYLAAKFPEQFDPNRPLVDNLMMLVKPILTKRVRYNDVNYLPSEDYDYTDIL